MKMNSSKDWWKQSVVYQIYPRSFQDSNGDGVGDIQGVIRRLDYLKDLGVDILWLSPVYESPNDDNGYDISDYYNIMKEFGTMSDFEQLINGIHERGMKLVMDLVVNHTSDEHTWFKQSRVSKTNPFRDYYIWKPGKNGDPPNNWRSMFGGPAWEFDALTGEYYLHLFSKKQPDLNWENPDVRTSVYAMMKWWVDKGVDGFRMDVINFISKQPGFPDGIEGDGKPYFENGPNIHNYLKEMYAQVVEPAGLLTIGEMPDVTVMDAKRYTNPDQKELDMVFAFDHVDLGYGKYGKWSVEKWSLPQLKNILFRWQRGLNDHGWNSLYWSNHDQPRAVSRYGDDREAFRELSAKMLAVCLHMLKGTPFIYQGEELGMTNTAFDSVDEYRDIEILNAYRDYCENGMIGEKDFMHAVHCHGRDNARVPMAWDNSQNGGFTTGEPWIGVSKNYKYINAKVNIESETSIYSFYKKLIQLRRENKMMAYGSFEAILEEDKNIFSYIRRYKSEQWLVACNFTDREISFDLPLKYRGWNTGQVIISNYDVFLGNLPEFKLRPYEAVVLSVG